MGWLRGALAAVLICIQLSGSRGHGQTPLYYGTSSATQTSNTVQRVNSNGTGNTLLFTATGATPGNGVRRCTAVAVDSWNGKIFLLDAGSNTLWSVNLDGSGLTPVRAALTNAPVGMALDVLREQIYYSTTSTVQGRNTIQRMDYNGGNNTVVFSATGPPPGNGVRRCTALAVDPVNSKIFIADAGANAIWSINLAGTALATVKSGLTATPMDLALDVTNQFVYFTTSSTIQNSNTIQRVAYNGAGSSTLLVASNGVKRCTALDLDLPNARVYFSDAGSNALWSVSTAGGAPTLVKNGLSAAAVRKVRLLPSASLITVVNNNDSGPGSLRQAMVDITSPGVINFSSGLFSNGPAVIILTSIGDPTYGSSAIRVDKQVAILGPTGTNSLIITRSNAAMRLFYVSATGNLTLKNLSLTNGFALGAIGGSGYQRGGSGGGAGGLGGAIFNEGTLDIENSTFVANQAQGGDGGGTAEPWGGAGSGGGGGGLIGPGGAGGQTSIGGGGGPPNGGAGGSGTSPGTAGGVGGGGGGGGSGASGFGSGPGGAGGFGGGGGGGGAYNTGGFPGGLGGPGGTGGFAGGGGGGGGGTPDGAFGAGGFGGGNGASANTGDGNVGNGGGGGGGLGGAIFNSTGILTITNCTFSGNAAIGGAGGDISAPASPGLGLGGAIFNRNGKITALNSTLANNRADQGGGGIYNLGDGTNGTVSLRNAIVAYTPGGAFDYVAAAISGGTTTNTGNSNLIQLNSGFAGGIISSADPRLGPLANNGGPTLTHALLNQSPAIDAGDNTALPATDQRGYPRIADGDGNATAIVDLGAVEQGLFRLRTIPQTASNIQLLGFQLFLTGESNRLYVLDFSPDLVSWTSFATSQVAGVEVPVTDTHTGTATRRFYRAHTSP